MTRRTVVALWAALAVAGGATAVSVVIIGTGDGHRVAAQPSDVDPGAAVALSTSTPAPRSSPAPATTPVPRTSTPSRRTTTTARRTTTPPVVTSRSGPGPLSISIPAAGIDAPVEAIGVDRTGEVAIPENVGTVGWYRYSPDPPATEGSTVLVGHVDSAVQGEGAFFRLRLLEAGDRVTLRLAHGRVLTYRVVSRERFPKTRVPLDALFSTTGAPRLTLITCGGSFDATVRSYRDNIVVTAVPA